MTLCGDFGLIDPLISCVSVRASTVYVCKLLLLLIRWVKRPPDSQSLEWWQLSWNVTLHKSSKRRGLLQPAFYWFLFLAVTYSIFDKGLDKVHILIILLSFKHIEVELLLCYSLDQISNPSIHYMLFPVCLPQAEVIVLQAQCTYASDSQTSPQVLDSVSGMWNLLR